MRRFRKQIRLTTPYSEIYTSTARIFRLTVIKHVRQSINDTINTPENHFTTAITFI